ncbi:MAG: TetR/AcrR family transcriptional regulator [Anaerolineaceae bacterium]|nr:TetR/AcrR family transcriptional regulator [Anaerolineaceae bacterium]
MPKETFYNLPKEKREGIVNILLEEFSEQTYKSVSISRIVEKAGIAKGSFYQYFEDKADCSLHLVNLAMEEKRKFFNHIPPPDPDMDLFALLRWMLDIGTQFEFSSRRLSQIIYRAVIEEVPLPDETNALIKQGSQDYFKQMISDGISKGDINPEIDPDVGAFIFNAIFTNLGTHLLEQYTEGPEVLLENNLEVFKSEAIQHVFDQVIHILEHGFKK